mgnify:CR=1 FL=1
MLKAQIFNYFRIKIKVYNRMYILLLHLLES